MAIQSRAQQTREKIIAGAAEVFHRVGYQSASLAEITTSAQVTKGALYFHFNSKAEVAMAVIEAQRELVAAGAVVIVSQAPSAVEAMLLLCEDLASRLLTDPIVKAGIRLTTDAWVFEAPPRGPYDDWLATFESLVAAGIEQGDIVRSIKPEMLAHFIIPAFTGVQMVSDVMNERADLHQRVREMWQILLPSIIVPDRVEAFQRKLGEIFPAESGSESVTQ